MDLGKVLMMAKSGKIHPGADLPEILLAKKKGKKSEWIHAWDFTKSMLDTGTKSGTVNATTNGIRNNNGCYLISENTYTRFAGLVPEVNTDYIIGFGSIDRRIGGRLLTTNNGLGLWVANDGSLELHCNGVIDTYPVVTNLKNNQLKIHINNNWTWTVSLNGSELFTSVHPCNMSGLTDLYIGYSVQSIYYYYIREFGVFGR